jgi:hypothetical protein
MKRTQNAREAEAAARNVGWLSLQLRRRPGLWLLLFVPVWAGVLWDTRDAVQPQVPWLDEKIALHRAASMADGELFDRDGGWLQPPGYPALLALLRAPIPPPDGVLPKPGLPPLWQLAQIAAWFGILASLAACGRTALGGRASWIPATLFLLYAEGWLLALRPLPEIWLGLASAILALWTLRPGARSAWHFFGLGLVAGAATLLRGHAFLLAVPLLLSLLSSRSRRVAAAVACGVLLPIVIPSALHSVKQGAFAGPSTNAGINLYIGNRAGANGLYNMDTGYDFARDPAGRTWLSDLGGMAAGTLTDVDRQWRRLALDHMRRHPGAALRLLLRKSWLQLAATEIPQIDGISAWRRFAPRLHLFFLPFGVLSALALVTIFCRPSNPAVRNHAATLVLLVAAQSAFFVVGRFRLIFVPQLCLLSAFALVHLSGLFRSKSQRPRTAVAACAAIVLVIPWGLGGVRAALREGVDASLGARWSQLIAVRHTAGDELEAFAQLERWSRIGVGVPLDERAGILHVKLLSERARHEDAMARADHLQRQFPDSPRVAYARAISCIRGGKLEDAERILRAAKSRWMQDTQLRKLWQNLQEDMHG